MQSLAWAIDKNLIPDYIFTDFCADWSTARRKNIFDKFFVIIYAQKVDKAEEGEKLLSSPRGQIIPCGREGKKSCYDIIYGYLEGEK